MLRGGLNRLVYTATHGPHAEDTEEAKHVEVLALFSSPRRFRNGDRITPLQLMREVAALQENIPRRLREVRHAVSTRGPLGLLSRGLTMPLTMPLLSCEPAAC